MVDLGHRKPQRGEVLFLRQLAAQGGLHAGQRLLGAANLVAGTGRLDDARDILRLVAKIHQAGGQPPHRPQHHPVQRQRRQYRDKARDEQRQRQNIHRVAHHRIFQRPLAHRDLDKVSAHRRVAHHIEVAPGRRGKRAERRRNGLTRGRLAQVVGLVNLRRHGGDCKQAARVMHLQHDGFCADAHQQLLLQVFRHHVLGGRLQHQRRDACGRQPVAQPVIAEIGDGGDIDRHFRQHDENNDQRQHAPRKAKAHRLVFGARSGLVGHGGSAPETQKAEQASESGPRQLRRIP